MWRGRQLAMQQFSAAGALLESSHRGSVLTPLLLLRLLLLLLLASTSLPAFCHLMLTCC